jgi:hypothetical protein
MQQQGRTRSVEETGFGSDVKDLREKEGKKDKGKKLRG